MKQIMKKISDICKLIFGYGVMIVLFAGGLTFFGYLAAVIIGGDTAALICHVLYKEIIPVIIYSANILIILGLIAMYLAGEKALTPNSKNKTAAQKK